MTPEQLMELAQTNLLNAIVAASADPMADYNIDGQEFKWGSYLASLLQAFRQLNDEIDRLKPPRSFWLGKEIE